MTLARTLAALVPGLALAMPAPAAPPIQPDTPAQAATPAPRPWPRTYTRNDTTVIIYAPQVDSWPNYTTLNFRAAIAVTTADAKVHYGVIAARADTLVDHDARTVLITNIDLASRFPGLSDDQAGPLKALVADCLPSLTYLDISLDEVNAHLHQETTVRTADVSLAPPPIFYSDVPAILVTYIGQPQFKPVHDPSLMFAVNTNWVVLMDTPSAQYYLLNGDHWLTAPDPLKGPWTAATSLPASISKLPDSGNWADVKKHVPGTPASSSSKVITSTQPAELIITQGPPDYSPISGTRLMYISNPTMPLFLDLIDSRYYFLVSGRWFRSSDPSGPWTAASADLPSEFARIPPDSPVGFVLASIPGTQECHDAVLMASVPHKATITIADAKLDVTYDGAPKFEPISGTTMTYAVNTAYQVVAVNATYYCCAQGVWFLAPAPTGPWTVCSSVPTVIYTIPPSSPLYNITYVQVYSATPTTVVVGYTAGYSGEYVAATGALMFGAGMVTGAMIAANADHWYCCSPCYYSYGCAAHYNYATGCYYRAGGECYGPHGGAGWGSAYNPSTGTWARAGAAYGPDGAHYGAQAYNPWTNTYAQHTGGTNGYKSWGSSSVQQGSTWAQASHQSNARGTVAQASNSSGQWAEGAHSNATNSSVAKASNGDVYAGHDGNVYRKSDGSWQKYDGNGSWSDTSASRPTTPTTTPSTTPSTTQSRAQSAPQSAPQSGNDQWKSNWENHSGASANLSQHDVQNGLNQDAWSRSQGSQNAADSWQSRSAQHSDRSDSGANRWGGASRGSGGGGWGGRRR